MKSFAACSTAASKLAAAVRLGSAISSNGITGGLGGDGDGGGGGGGGEGRVMMGALCLPTFLGVRGGGGGPGGLGGGDGGGCGGGEPTMQLPSSRSAIGL